METLIKFKEKIDSILKERGFQIYYSYNKFGTTFNCWKFESCREYYVKNCRRYMGVIVDWNAHDSDDFKKTTLKFTVNVDDIGKENLPFVNGIFSRKNTLQHIKYVIDPYTVDDIGLSTFLRMIGYEIDGFKNER